MSCGIMQPDTYFNTRNWLDRSEKKGSGERLDLVTPPELHCSPHHTAALNNPPSMTIEDIKSQYNSCYTCGVSWSDNHVSLDCRECGGYSLERPCPTCDGKCHTQWHRDVSLSHSVGKAQWEGECAFTSHHTSHFNLVKGFESLSTSA